MKVSDQHSFLCSKNYYMYTILPLLLSLSFASKYMFIGILIFLIFVYLSSCWYPTVNLFLNFRKTNGEYSHILYKNKYICRVLKNKDIHYFEHMNNHYIIKNKESVYNQQSDETSDSQDEFTGNNKENSQQSQNISYVQNGPVDLNNNLETVDSTRVFSLSSAAQVISGNNASVQNGSVDLNNNLETIDSTRVFSESNRAEVISGNNASLQNGSVDLNNNLETIDYRGVCIERIITRKSFSFHEIFNFQSIQPTLHRLIPLKNLFPIPKPSFFDLLYQSLISPFFVFQIFSSLLWCLDEYPMHAFISVIMLFICECSLVLTRLKNLKEFGSLDVKKCQVILAYRNNMDKNTFLSFMVNKNTTGNSATTRKNTQNMKKSFEVSFNEKNANVADFKPINLSSHELFPGDIIALTVGLQIPCDLLILKGSCAVNESMLTGESIPLAKEDIYLRNQNEIFDYQKDKKHILFGGTELIKINENSEDDHLEQSSLVEDKTNEDIKKGGSVSKNSFYEDEVYRFENIEKIVQNLNENKDLLKDNYKKNINRLNKAKRIVNKSEETIQDKPYIICMVLRTGFQTEQGSLVKKMIVLEEVSINNKESFYFIAVLLVFAIISSLYVIQDYFKESYVYKTPYKLLLEVIMILTNVVPPELPMEMTLAVNSAMQSLFSKSIFCLEAFRIPICGKVDVCCFDKTGTLTDTDLELKSIILLEDLENTETSEEVAEDDENTRPALLFKEGIKSTDTLSKKSRIGGKDAGINKMKKSSASSKADSDAKKTSILLKGKHNITISTEQKMEACIATCHSVIKVENVIGDPLETSAFKYFNIEMLNDNETVKGKEKYKIIKRYSFSSELRRMTVISELNNRVFVAMKGAPEVVMNYLEQVPREYNQYKEYAKQGYRVIAIAYKKWSRNYKRQEVEKNLEFVGFLLYESKIKEETKESIKMLKESGHKVVMITGDNLLTAICVAKKIGIIDDDDNEVDDKNDFKRSIVSEDNIQRPSSSEKNNNTDEGYAENDFKGSIVSEDNIQRPSSTKKNNTDEGYTENDFKSSIVSEDNIKKRSVYEDDFGVIHECGVGVEGERINEILKDDDFYKYKVFARANPKQKENILMRYKNDGLITLMCGDGTNDVGALKVAHVGVALVEKAKKPTQNEQGEYKVKLGDASVAAPFTAKTGSINAVLDIIRHGRSTLVTTIQMYKILALNSLISAYSLSVLDRMGIRYGEVQMTVSGILIAIAFMFLTRSKTLKAINKKKPLSNIFNKYLITSVMLQTIIHIFSFYFIVQTFSNNDIMYDNIGFGLKSSFVDQKYSNTEIVLLDSNTKNRIKQIANELKKTDENKDIETTDEQKDNEIKNQDINDKVKEIDGKTKFYNEYQKFKPSLLNSALFLLSVSQQISTFIINYIGRPYRESLLENTHLRNSLICVSAITLSLVFETHSAFSRFMEIVPMEGHKKKLATIIFFDFFTCYAIEKISFYLFML